MAAICLHDNPSQRVPSPLKESALAATLGQCCRTPFPVTALRSKAIHAAVSVPSFMQLQLWIPAAGSQAVSLRPLS